MVQSPVIAPPSKFEVRPSGWYDEFVSPSPSFGTAHAPKLSAARILIVDDNEVDQLLLLMLAQRLGLDSHVVGSGSDALTELEHHDYFLVLMDCEMPGMSGYEATRRWRRYSEGRAPIPIIAMADTDHRNRGACTAAGMNDHLSKPIRESELVACIERWNNTSPVCTSGKDTKHCPRVREEIGSISVR